MENKTIIACSPLLLTAPREAETFDVHVSFGIYSLFTKKTFFKGEKARLKKIKISATQDLIDFLSNNCRESKKVAEKIGEEEKKLFEFKVKRSECGFVQYPKPKEMVRWNIKENRLEEKNSNGGWIESEILKMNKGKSKTKNQKRIKTLIKGLQATLISEIGDIKYSYLAITNPDSCFISLHSKGKKYHDSEKREKIFFEISLLKALAMAAGYNHCNIPAPDVFFLKWF
jgi:hypothetical protein